MRARCPVAGETLSAVAACEEPIVRRLTAGERWIRTIGSAAQQALCRARDEGPGRDDPLRRQLGSGCKAELDQPTTLRRVRLARTRVWRSYVWRCTCRT